MRNANNHAGWEVQEMTDKGWINCIKRQSDGTGFLFDKKKTAEEFAVAIFKADGREYRVYEAVR